MTQNNTTDYNDTISGTQLANFLNDDFTAELTNHKGSSRPSYAQAGLVWIDDTSDPWLLKLYDGSDDITIGEIDTTNNNYELSSDFDTSTIAGLFLSDDGSDNLTVDLGTLLENDGSGNITVNVDAIEADNLAGNNGTDGQVLTTDGTNVNWEAGATEIRNYLDPDGLVISNNSTDSDHDIDVDGGRVWVNDDSGGSFDSDSSSGQLVTLADESPAFQIDTTGDNGLINTSSLSADTWYELGIIADSSGSNSPSVVGYTDANRPTVSGDLPTGFDLFRAMGTPGKTWWVRTDGSSNILSFKSNSNGKITWTPTTLNGFSNLFFTSSPNSSETVDLSNQMPPTKADVKFSAFQLASNANGSAQLNAHNESMSATVNGQTFLNAPTQRDVVTTAVINKIETQTLHLFFDNISNIEDVIVRKISAFEAVN
jgi:hypothetical protein